MRNVFIVNATHVVTSDSHPEGVYSVIQGYPKTYDSRNYEATAQNPNGNDALALIVAKAEFADRVKELSIAKNRVMWSVTLERADGRQIMRETFGSFPDMTPVPVIEPVVESDVESED